MRVSVYVLRDALRNNRRHRIMRQQCPHPFPLPRQDPKQPYCGGALEHPALAEAAHLVHGHPPHQLLLATCQRHHMCQLSWCRAARSFPLQLAEQARLALVAPVHARAVAAD